MKVRVCLCRVLAPVALNSHANWALLSSSNLPISNTSAERHVRPLSRPLPLHDTHYSTIYHSAPRPASAIAGMASRTPTPDSMGPRDRLPNLFEVLSRRTTAPVDLFSFYIYMRDVQRSVDYLDFWYVKTGREWSDGGRKTMVGACARLTTFG